MTITNAIKKVVKATGKTPVKERMFFKTQIGNYILSFSQNGNSDEVSTISVCRFDDKPDVMSDYFPQFYFDNITQALKWAMSQTF